VCGPVLPLRTNLLALMLELEKLQMNVLNLTNVDCRRLAVSRRMQWWCACSHCRRKANSVCTPWRLWQPTPSTLLRQHPRKRRWQLSGSCYKTLRQVQPPLSYPWFPVVWMCTDSSIEIEEATIFLYGTGDKGDARQQLMASIAQAALQKEVSRVHVHNCFLIY